MNESDGVIVHVEGGIAWIRMSQPGNPCGACARHEGCSVNAGTVLDGSQRERILKLPNDIAARQGDQVIVRTADGTVLKAVGRVYGLPLILGMAVAILLLSLSGSELQAFAGLMIGLGAGFFALRHQNARSRPVLTLEFKNVTGRSSIC